MSSALEIDAVSKSYPTRDGSLLALDSCSIAIAPQELHVIVGPSGCGKTTLLNAVAGFQEIDGGEIRLDGELLCAPGHAAAARRRPRRRLPAFDPLPLAHGARQRHLRADDPGPALARRGAGARPRAAGAGGTGGARGPLPEELSSGAQRRVEIVRALLNEPRALLLDEPFRGMDQITRGIMHEALLELYDRARPTVLFITHDIEEAVFLGSRVTVMSARPGRVKATLEIDLERPREPGLRASARFNELVADVVAVVHDEASRAFEAGDREAA